MKVPAQFKTDFDLVTRHYGIAGTELAECKRLVEQDFEAARDHYTAAAARIRRMQIGDRQKVPAC